ncbi:MAG: hypothetical protein AABZ33_00085 [Chloroflexota bacterium]|mgnify:CR=1 FL=1
MTDEPRWDDERVDIAFHEAFDHPAPAHLATETVARLSTASRPRGERWHPSLMGVAGIAAALVAAIAVLSGPLRPTPNVGDRPTDSPTPATTPSPAPIDWPAYPDSVHGLPVITVSDAIDHRDTALDDTELAVGGFYVGSGPISCPAPALEYLVSPIFPRCPATFTWILDIPEELVKELPNGWEGRPPTRPGLNPIFDLASGFDAPPGVRLSGRIVPIVAIGHFADHRSVLCPDSDVEVCRRQFVVDRVAWVDGTVTEIAPWQSLEVYDASGAAKALVPTLDENAVRSRVASIASGDLLSIGAIPFSRVSEIEPAANSRAIVADHVVWIARVLVTATGTPHVRTLLVHEGTSGVSEILGDGSAAPAGPSGGIVWLPPWSNPGDAPAEVATRPPLPFCGLEGSMDQLFLFPDDAARSCFLDAWETGTAAELARIQSTIEGDPIATILRIEPGGRITIYRDTTQDAFGARVWTRQECVDLLPAQPVDFVLGGCNEGVVLD